MGNYHASMAIELLNELKNEPSTNKKKDIIKRYEGRFGDNIVDFLNDILSPYIVFGIDKATLGNLDKYYNDASFELVGDWSLSMLINFLKENSSSTDYKKSIVAGYLSYYEADEEYYDTLKNIIERNPRCGVGITLVNKAIGREVIDEFSVMLAKPLKQFPNKAISEPKVDGVRIALHVEADCEVTMRTRNGELVTGYDDIVNQFKKYAQRTSLVRQMVFDGEVVSNNFDATMEGLFRKGGNKKGKFVVWDMLTEYEFFNRLCYLPQYDRKIRLDNILKDVVNIQPNDFVSVMPYIYVTNEEHAYDLHCDYVARGYEGSIIKDANALYSFDTKSRRGYGWQKIKDFHTEDYRIIRVTEGTGKYTGMMGAVFVDVDGVEVKVGSGFSDLQRKLIYDNPENYIGSYIEVQYQEKTKDCSLRFPSFKRFRHDK